VGCGRSVVTLCFGVGREVIGRVGVEPVAIGRATQADPSVVDLVVDAGRSVGTE
jgi:hypothetical protein